MKLAFRGHRGVFLFALLGALTVAGMTGFRSVPQKTSPSAPPENPAKTKLASRVRVPAKALLADNLSPGAQAMANLDLLNAMKIGGVEASFHGNGHDVLTIVAVNTKSQPVHVTVRGGLAFQSGRNVLLTLRPTDFTLQAGQTHEQTIAAAALTSTNEPAELDYCFTHLDLARYQPLFDYLAEHPQVSTAAAQTALLALSENLPLRAVAKFACKGADLTSRFDTSAFKVDTADIVSALLVLQDLGMDPEEIALTIDPQLRLEAMIDPLAHALAMRYYGIAPAAEWDFWKSELTKGDPGMRHYALYGIARFFPDVALQMLPRWAREIKTSPVLRLAAVQALTETQRPEAASVLRSLAYDLDEKTELGKTARAAADYMEARLGRVPAAPAFVFRSASSITAR